MHSCLATVMMNKETFIMQPFSQWYCFALHVHSRNKEFIICILINITDAKVQLPPMKKFFV